MLDFEQQFFESHFHRHFSIFLTISYRVFSSCAQSSGATFFKVLRSLGYELASLRNVFFQGYDTSCFLIFSLGCCLTTHLLDLIVNFEVLLRF